MTSSTFDFHDRIAHDRSAAFESAATRSRLVRDVRPGWRSMFRRRGPA
jgi:hypothetical protein